MRTVLAIAATVALLPAPAAAQNALGGLIGLLNTGRSITSTASYGCSGNGLQQILCQTQRAQSVTDQLAWQRQAAANRQQQAQNREYQISQALTRACRAGDQYSCERAGPQMDQRQIDMLNALRDACNAGDGPSCRRADGMSNQITSAQRAARSGY